jgi:hypothetical protein
MNMNNDPFEMGDDYGMMVQEKLEHVLENYSPQAVARVIRKVVENLVITERIINRRGIHIEESEIRRLVEKEHPEIQAEVDRALGGLIGSILSREGG